MRLSSNASKADETHQCDAASDHRISSPNGPFHDDPEKAGQQCQRSASGKPTQMETDDIQVMPSQAQFSQNGAVAIVFSPRVPGEEASNGDQCFRSVSPTAINEILEKSGMALRIPNFLEKVSRDAREDLKAKFKLRLNGPGLRRSLRSVKLKPNAPGLVTTLSAKQWLLQSLGLKDSEIYELFHQMEFMPQFAAEYIREVKEEWQAMELREMQKPPAVEYLSKDQALLEKVRALIVRVVRVHECENIFVRQQEGQTKEKDGSVLGSHANCQKKSLHFQSEKNNHDSKHSWKAESVPLSRPDHGVPSRSTDKLDDSQSSKFMFCSSCGQMRMNTPNVHSQQGIPETNPIQRELALQLRHALPSFIPVDDYIVEHCVLQPEPHGKMEHKSRFSPLDKRWYTVLFPALQPGKREDVQLLGEWLQHSMYRNCHENSDGQFEDPETAFILQSIAFLEVVRQVDLQCEERGNLLLHVWRQILRVFNQASLKL